MTQRLILMKGHPCTGKSTLAQAVAQRWQWPLIDKDDVKDHTLNLPGGNVLAYSILWQIAATQLHLGLSVIVDSPLSYPIGYDTGQALAQQTGARLLVVETALPEAIWRARLEARSAAESQHKIRGWAMMQTLLQEYDGCWDYPIDPTRHLVVDTTQSIDELIIMLQHHLNH